MEVRFPLRQICKLSEQYEREMSARDRKLTDIIENELFPSYRRKKYLSKKEFITVCEWKTPRSKLHCESNDEKLIRDISRLAAETKSEQLRIQAWTLLSGVKWPTASVFLHFLYKNKYPILDFRALEALGIKRKIQYNFSFWWRYTLYCRKLGKRAGVNLRTLDKALWKYSKLH